MLKILKFKKKDTKTQNTGGDYEWWNKGDHKCKHKYEENERNAKN